MNLKKLITESASKEAMGIAAFTATRGDAVQKFIDDNGIDASALYKYVKNGKMPERMAFVSALVGNPGNKMFKMIVSKFGMSESVTELKKLSSGNFSIKKAYNTFADYEKNAKVGDTILKYDKRGQMIKTFVNGSELDKNAEKYLDKVNNITSGVVYLSKKGMKGVAQVPDYEKKEVGVLVLESKINEAQDHEVSMSQNSLDSIIKYATELKQKMGEMEKDIPAWIQDHITNAENYISQASSNYHDYDGISESINEVDGMLNKKVYKLLMKELGDLRTGGPNHQFAVMHVLIGALRDANFHSDAKKVPALFPKAEYEGDPMGKEDTIDIYEYDLGPKIANMAQWDGGAIVDAIAFYTSMTIGRPLGQKIEKLVESKS